MAELILPSGDVVLIDESDQSLISGYVWCIKRESNTNYAQARIRNPKTNRWTTIAMHQLILGVTGESSQVDHVNHNGLDNRRKNLRPATGSQNQGNHRVSKNNTSGYKGVSWHKRRQKWRAYITVSGHHRHLGLFVDAWEAAKAYNVAALAQWGSFALLNKQQLINEDAR